MSKAPLFEHKTCTRCGGCGEYSYNQMHGSRCFGCSGSGYQLTARGRAAQNFLNSLRKIAIEQVKVGDLIRYDGIAKSVFSPVTAVDAFPACQTFVNETGMAYRIVCGEGSMTAREGSLVIKGFTAAEKHAQREQALAYQATLTKLGKPSKACKTKEAA